MKLYDAVQKVYQELLCRNCNGYAKIRLGELIASKEEFITVFQRFVRGTKLEKTKLEIEIEKAVVHCSCGYFGQGIIPKIFDTKHARCPECNESASIVSGNSLEIVKIE